MDKIENILGDGIGSLELVTTWGSDEDIIRAARMSTNKGFQGWEDTYHYECICGYKTTSAHPEHEDIFVKPGCPSEVHYPNFKELEFVKHTKGDHNLLRYLYTHKHMTPFEMAGMVIEVQAPIMVFREWHRHRTQSFNEMSGRYTELPDLYYIPSIERMMNSKQSKSNKQSSEGGFSESDAKQYIGFIDYATRQSRNEYEDLLSFGVSREVARLVLPVNQYSRMRVSANLRNWLAFLELRLPENAQWEIRQYAKAIAVLINDKFPRTFTLFSEGTGHQLPDYRSNPV